MKILFFCAYFYPEIIPSQHLTDDLLEGLVKSGHSIEIYAPMPTRGVSDSVRNEYKKNKTQEIFDGKCVIRRFSLYGEGTNVIMRALRYFLMICIFFIKGLFAKADAIFVYSTPPIQGLMAGMVKKVKKIPFIYCLQDIFPDSLVTAGLTHEGSALWKIGRKIENFTYNAADSIILISNDFKKNLLNKGVDEKKLSVIYNWVDTDAVMPVSNNDNKLFDEFGISENKFRVLYAGNFGKVQGADIILKAAELALKYEDIQFVIFGGGVEFEDAKKYVAENNLSNVIINDLLPENRVPEVYSIGDVAIITCKAGTGNSGMPSKTWNIMACNTPVIACFDRDSELCRIIESSGAGVCITPEDPEALIDEILHFKQMKADGVVYGSRQYAVDNASKLECVRKNIDCIEKAGVN